ncbi:hypothetical protein [Nocardioides zeae]|uniref:Uncharacterized protein n=1 Tax=Nocardioides zeae TaxID=1457234 RepID=A0AAJ1U593_9ACTN|nr:hypothetical protein [Nocardioides zeae]MDQ1106200.1 hypothetical protein [Nocardioides zeae]
MEVLGAEADEALGTDGLLGVGDAGDQRGRHAAGPPERPQPRLQLAGEPDEPSRGHLGVTRGLVGQLGDEVAHDRAGVHEAGVLHPGREPDPGGHELLRGAEAKAHELPPPPVPGVVEGGGGRGESALGRGLGHEVASVPVASGPVASGRHGHQRVVEVHAAGPAAVAAREAGVGIGA